MRVNGVKVVKGYTTDEAERKFDKRVMRLVWFGNGCLAVGIIITHYWH